eukprot:jgi/Orpsp1_1/1178266/evm.model.c7180000064623.1
MTQWKLTFTGLRKEQTDVKYSPPHKKLYIEDKKNYSEERKNGVCFLCAYMNFIYPNFAKYAGINLQLMFDSDSEFSDSNNECNKENTRNNNYLNNNENLCNKIFSCKIIKNINKNKLSISETTYNLNNDLDDFSLFNNCENLSISDGFKDSNNIENLSVSDEFRDLNEIENLSVFVFHENFLNCVNFNKLENLNNFDNYNKVRDLDKDDLDKNENLNKNKLNWDEN